MANKIQSFNNKVTHNFYHILLSYHMLGPHLKKAISIYVCYESNNFVVLFNMKSVCLIYEIQSMTHVSMTVFNVNLLVGFGDMEYS